MAESPEDRTYLAGLIERSPLLPEARLRAHWLGLLPWLEVDERYELAAVLVNVEHVIRDSSA
ncbi:MAG: hypothetical protein JOY61_02290 [Chloroflexi bacterium]|nr:hypothetical protein [Chloroflexota bacterium]